jgi:hypothetical protein
LHLQSLALAFALALALAMAEPPKGIKRRLFANESEQVIIGPWPLSPTGRGRRQRGVEGEGRRGLPFTILKAIHKFRRL